MKQSVMPTRRDMKFTLDPSKITSWHGHSMHIAQFLNSMSLFFPVGERFFIHSVRLYRDQITDPELQKAVTAFIGQEAMHGREHEEYNEHMHSHGLPVKWMEKQVWRLLEGVKKTAPNSLQLAATVALEHLTAIMGDMLLRDDRILEGADPKYAALWRWHALEETEHKAVAFDVYKEVMKNNPAYGYALRSFALVLATSIFFAMLYPYWIEMVRREKGLFKIRGWLSAINFQWGTPGGLRQVVPQWLEWFKPGFHPWDHDNSHYLENIDEQLAGTLPKNARARVKAA